MYLRQQQHVEMELSHSLHSPHWVWFGNKQRPNAATMIRRDDDELQGVGQIDNNYLMFYIIIFYIYLFILSYFQFYYKIAAAFNILGALGFLNDSYLSDNILVMTAIFLGFSPSISL